MSIISNLPIQNWEVLGDLRLLLEPLTGRVHHLTHPGPGFDFVDTPGVLHHLENPQEGLQALAELLRCMQQPKSRRSKGNQVQWNYQLSSDHQHGKWCQMNP